MMRTRDDSRPIRPISRHHTSSNLSRTPTSTKSPSRSISPLSGPVRLKQKIVPNLRIGVRESVAFDECRTERRSEMRKQRWELPETREELINRYSYRSKGMQEAFLLSPFPAYKLDAAELLVGRLSKLLSKSLHHLQQQVMKAYVPDYQDTRQDSVSFHWEDEELRIKSPSFFLQPSDNPRDSAEIETPKPFHLWKDSDSLISHHKTQKTGGVISEIRTGLDSLFKPINRLIKTCKFASFTRIKVVSMKKKSIFCLISSLNSVLTLQFQPFFSHELFHLSASQYSYYKHMLISVNRLIQVTKKTLQSFIFRQLRYKNRVKRLNYGVNFLWKVGYRRVQEHFNRLRFFAEVLGDFREKEKRRSRVRRAVKKLVYFLSLLTKVNYHAGVIALWRFSRGSEKVMSNSGEFRRDLMEIEGGRIQAVGSIVAILRKNAYYRAKTALIVWKEAGKTVHSVTTTHLNRIMTLSTVYSQRIALLHWHKTHFKPCLSLLFTLNDIKIRIQMSVWKQFNTRKSRKIEIFMIKRALFRLVKRQKSQFFLNLQQKTKIWREAGQRIGSFLMRKRRIAVKKVFFALL